MTVANSSLRQKLEAIYLQCKRIAIYTFTSHPSSRRHRRDMFIVPNSQNPFLAPFGATGCCDQRLRNRLLIHFAELRNLSVCKGRFETNGDSFMNTSNHKSFETFWLTFPILLAALVFGCRCTTSKASAGPLAGWNLLLGHKYDNFDKAVKEDYKLYIDRLPNGEKQFVGPIQLFEDGNGQHAVRIEIALNGTDWAHVLIYDRDNKRIKVIKYVSNHYRS